MNKQKIFGSMYFYILIKSIINALESMIQTLNKYEDNEKVSEISYEDINDIVYKTEKIALSLRDVAADKIDFDDEESIKEIENYYLKDVVKVEFENNVLRVKTPLTFKRFYKKHYEKENYILVNYIEAALKLWQIKNKNTLYNCIDSPIICVMIRKDTKFNRTKICDNDNLENGRIVNKIMQVINQNDNASNMDLYSCFRIVEDANDVGMEFLIMNRRDFNPEMLDV